MMNSAIFSRKDLADRMAEQILTPSALTDLLHSGLFLSGPRRIGKTTFLKNDLIPALEERGAIVIYVDLWSDVKANPRQLVMGAIQKALTELQDPASTLLGKIARVRSLEVGALGFKFGFNLASVGTDQGPTLEEAAQRVVDQTRSSLVLIVDEVQQAITTDDGRSLLQTLKSVREAVNLRPVSAGRFIFIGTGSHRAMVNELVARRSQAFQGAHSMEFPLLGEDYVEYVLGSLRAAGVEDLPSPAVAAAGFRTLGSRPEEFKKALLQLAQRGELAADDAFPLIAATLRGAAADVEIRRLEDLGELAVAVFDKIAESEQGQRGLFSADSAAGYASQLGRPVPISELQPVVNVLLDENLIMRRGHGIYEVADPVVRSVWLERRRLR